MFTDDVTLNSKQSTEVDIFYLIVYYDSVLTVSLASVVNKITEYSKDTQHHFISLVKRTRWRSTIMTHAT